MDDALVELCLPDSRFTLSSLYSCLHAVETESPRDTHRYPQAVADAIGDLAVSIYNVFSKNFETYRFLKDAVRVFELLEGPLLNKADLGHEEALSEVQAWEEKQDLSIRAATNISSYTGIVNPLLNLKNKDKLKRFWDILEQACLSSMIWP